MFSGLYTAWLRERSITVWISWKSGRSRTASSRRRKSLGVGSPLPRYRDSPSSARKPLSFSSFSSGGLSCTRYRAGISCFCRKSAVATLAHSMHSSISRCASLRWAGLISRFLRPAALGARLEQHLAQPVQLLQVRAHLGQLLAQLRRFRAVRMLQQLADLVVGEARVGVDHRLAETVAGHPAALRQVDDAHHRQAVHLRVERAQAVEIGRASYRERGNRYGR